MQKRERNVQKSVMHVQSCFLLIKPIVFLTFSLSSASLDLKVPSNNEDDDDDNDNDDDVNGC